MHLTSHTGIKPRYLGQTSTHSYPVDSVPGSSVPAPSTAPSRSLQRCAREALPAARRRNGQALAPDPANVRRLRSMRSLYGHAPARVTIGNGKAFVDYQNDVTTADLSVAFQEGFVSVEHLKRYTTLGMGTDQGKTSNINAIGLMATLRGLTIEATGTTTFRPPYAPVSIGALAGRSTGQHFRPTRRSPLHDWHTANGGVFTDAGPWKRALYYRWAGPTVEVAYVAEMSLVRTAVGLSDVSTLGKIDVQGPDAAEFLNRIYVNGFAKLPIGRARYGVMLNDDATVLDDGTTARFAESQYFLTTTTAQAGEVMSRLEFLLQTAWSDLRVNVTSLTDQWAGLCVAGPKARSALELALPGAHLADAELPHMGCTEIRWSDIPVRILRLSFSGELAYELYVPADYGVAVWEHLLRAAAPTGIRPYGLEALASLRIEKGHVAGLELDRRTTLDDWPRQDGRQGQGLHRPRVTPARGPAGSTALEPDRNRMRRSRYKVARWRDTVCDRRPDQRPRSGLCDVGHLVHAA